MTGDERRDHILQTAKHVFAQFGYREASTGDLARAGGITEPVLYKHFGSKKGLILAVVERYGNRFSHMWQNRLTDASQTRLLDALADIGLAYRQAIKEDPDTLRVIFRAIAESNDPDIAALTRANIQDAYAFVRDLLARAQQNGDIDATVNVNAATWGYLSMGFAMQISLMLNLDDSLNEETLRAMNRLWLDGLHAAPTTA